MNDYAYIRTSRSADGRVARIMLNRPEARNAQNRGMLVELNDAMLAAEADDDVRVVILGGEGSMFSSGHDLSSKIRLLEQTPGPKQHPSTLINGGTREGAEARTLQEWHYFYNNTRRWRDLRKITVAEVQGKVYAAGLMLAWSCDLIIAAAGTTFADIVGTRLGMCGVEYFAHPWEFGLRKTKELMLTGDSIEAEEAFRLGMVSKVFPVDSLRADTDIFAERIAALPSMTSLLIKEAVNQTQDNMGFHNSLNACFTLHQLNHSHWAEIHEDKVARGHESDGIVDWKVAPPVVLSVKDKPRGDAAEPSEHTLANQGQANVSRSGS